MGQNFVNALRGVTPKTELGRATKHFLVVSLHRGPSFYDRALRTANALCGVYFLPAALKAPGR
jgi:hypothetical protein